MAGIDHTTIVYKNGRHIQGKSIKSCGYSFSYDRDGRIHKIETPNGLITEDNFKHVEISSNYDVKHFYKHNKVLNGMLNLLKFKEKKVIESAFHFKDDVVELFVYMTEMFNVSYLFTSKDNFIILGGYGHNQNPYTHFYHRGYGEQFEKKMCKDCYEWLCEEVFKDLLRDIDIRRYFDAPFEFDDTLKTYYKKLKYVPWYER